MSLINNGMDAGDIVMLVDEEYDDENVSEWEVSVNESDERAGVPVEIDDDITEDEYEDILSNDDVTNPAGEPSMLLKAAMESSEFIDVEDQVMDIFIDDEEEDELIDESDIEEYDMEIDPDIEALMDDDDFYEEL